MDVDLSVFRFGGTPVGSEAELRRETCLVVEMAPTSARTLNTSYRLGRPMDGDTDVSRLPPRVASLLASDAGVSARA